MQCKTRLTKKRCKSKKDKYIPIMSGDPAQLRGRFVSLSFKLLSEVAMNIFEALLLLAKILLGLFMLYLVYHGYIVFKAYRWRAEDRLIARALEHDNG